jgi:hypothetical protein
MIMSSSCGPACAMLSAEPAPTTEPCRRLDTVIHMDLAIAIIGALAAIGAAVAAFGSWTAARKANDTAAALAAIEADRRHDELTPCSK